MDRRRFLHLFTVAVGGTLLAACSQPAAPAATPAPARPSAPAGTAAPAAQPVAPAAPSGAAEMLNVGIWVQPTVLDPDVENTDYGVGMLRNVYEPLVDLKGDTLELEGVLATAWKASPDAREYTFELRRGVKFSDGADFNAAAAKASFDRVLQLKKGPYWVAKDIESVQTNGDGGLSVRLSKPFPFLPALRLIPMVSPAAVAANDAGGDLAAKWLSEHSAGTGAYAVDHWTRGTEIVLTRNPTWRGWAERQGKKTFDQVVIKEVLEPSTQLLMLKNGDLDIAQSYNQDAVPELKNTPNVTVPEAPNLQQMYIRLNMVAGPTRDVRVRQALNYAWDPKAFDAVLPGAFTPADGPLPKELLGDQAPPTPYRYDLDRAKKLLADAGFPNGGFTLSFWTVKGDELKRLAGEVLQGQLAKLNVNVETKVSTWPAQFQELSDWASKTRDPASATSAFPLFTGPRFPDAYAVAWFMWHTAAAGPDGRNWGYYSNPKVDDLIDRASGIVDQAQSQELYRQAAALIADDAPDIFAGKLVLAMPMRTSVKGYVSRPANSRQVLFYDLWRG